MFYSKNFKNRYRTTPNNGTVSIYIDGELKHEKYHYDAQMRNNYCNKIFYDNISKPMEFIFKNEDIEILMLSHTPKEINEQARYPTMLPSYTIDGIEYFDADKFCKIYEHGYTSPASNNLQSLKF